MTNPENIFENLSESESEAIGEILALLLGGPTQMARFDIAPEFYRNEDQVQHLLVHACHEAYMTGCAHGAGVERDPGVDQSMGFDKYAQMTHLVKAEVDQYQIDNPGGYA